MSLEHMQPAPKSGRGRCPYCHEGFRSEEIGLWSCPGCGAHHHLECLEDFGSCTVYGCGSGAPSLRALSPSEHEAHKARRRARFFAARHASQPPPPLDSETLAFMQRITAEGERPLVELGYRLLPVILTLVMAAFVIAILAFLAAATR